MPGVQLPPSPLTDQTCEAGRGQRKDQSHLTDLSLARAERPGAEPASWTITLSGRQEGSRTLSFISKGLPSPTTGLSEGLVGVPASISPPLKEDQELSLALLSGSGQIAMSGSSGRKCPGRGAGPFIQSLSSLTATIIIIGRDGPEVVRDMVGVNEMKKSSVCAISPG